MTNKTSNNQSPNSISTLPSLKDIYRIIPIPSQTSVSSTSDTFSPAGVDIILESGEVITLHDCIYDPLLQSIYMNNNTKISLKGGN